MGIPNLLRFMKPFIEPVHIKKYAGKRVGIDAYSWLHKGAYSCATELCTNPRSDAAKGYLKYFMHHINLLRHYKVVPVVVLDGGNIPCKAATEMERQKRKEENLALAKEKLQQGNITVANEYFRKAVEVTPLMAHQLIQILRAESVEFLVAPYEADAQLAYLSTLDADQGGIAAVVTEDSDLIAYGCAAVLATLKLDKRYCMPEGYADCFRKAFAVFHHATVYDVKNKSLKHLKPLEEQCLQHLNGDLDVLGPELSPSTATAIAEGHLNPITMEAFDQLSRTNRSSMEYINISALNLANRRVAFSPQECHEEITVVERFRKEALALGKLFAQAESCPELQKNEAEGKAVPDNNPFKRRKLSTDQMELSVRKNESVMALGDDVPVVSQEKQKHLRKSRSKNDPKVSESSGILKFFQPA